MAEVLYGSGDFDYSFDSLIYDLADRMRKFDTIQVQQRELRIDLSAYDTQLEDLDPSIDLSAQPDHLAIAALGSHITNAELQHSRRAQIELENDSLSHKATFEHKRHRLAVTAVFPSDHYIGTSKMNRYGQYDGLSKWYDQRRGTVDSINLNPTNGGHITFKGRGGRFYNASPLVARDKGYVPAFRIQD